MRRWPLYLLALVLGIAGKSFAETSAAGPLVEQRADDLINISNFDPDLLAREMFTETNRVRKSEHRYRFGSSVRLNRAANEQASFMATMLRASHENILADLREPQDRFRAEGLALGRAAENVAMLPVGDRTYSDLAKVLVEAWMNSAGHRENLLNPNLVALGCAARLARMPSGEVCVFAVQDFYRP